MPSFQKKEDDFLALPCARCLPLSPMMSVNEGELEEKGYYENY
jgi:hypothetical protein